MRSRFITTAVLGMTVCSLAGLALAFAGEPLPSLFVQDRSRDAFSQPLPQLPDKLQASFFQGRSLFRQNWVIAPSREPTVDGLGPLHNRISCIACHSGNGKGHAPNGPNERARFALLRLSVPGQDSHGGPVPHPVYGDQLNEDSIPGVTPEGRVRMHWQEKSVTLAGGEHVVLRQPEIQVSQLGYGPLDDTLFSLRIGPAMFGLGLLESVDIAALERLAQTPQADGIQGKLNQVWDEASQQMMPGRFGLKSNRSTLRDQIAAAMLGDLGLTSSLFPHENCSATQTACQQAANGGHPELSETQLDDLETYLAFVAPPAPEPPTAQIQQGRLLFKDMGCATCHQPQLPLAHHPLLGDLTGQQVEAYTDLLVHDMGPELADNRPDYAANGQEWRTAPLWGAGLLRQMNARVAYLHDGRARTVQEAIVWHGGTAKPARERYTSASKTERQALLRFIASL